MTARIAFTASEYQADGTIARTAYELAGTTDAGWEVLRDGALHVRSARAKHRPARRRLTRQLVRDARDRPIGLVLRRGERDAQAHPAADAVMPRASAR